MSTMQRHIVVTTPPDGPSSPRARLDCTTCRASMYSDLRGDELQRFAYYDISWHINV